MPSSRVSDAGFGWVLATVLFALLPRVESGPGGQQAEFWGIRSWTASKFGASYPLSSDRRAEIRYLTGRHQEQRRLSRIVDVGGRMRIVPACLGIAAIAVLAAAPASPAKVKLYSVKQKGYVV